MEVFKSNEYKSRKDSFNREVSRIGRRELTKNVDLQNEYKECLITTYNELTQYLAACHETETDLTNRFNIRAKQETFINKLKVSFNILGYSCELGIEQFELVTIDHLNESVIEEGEEEEEFVGQQSNEVDNNLYLSASDSEQSNDLDRSIDTVEDISNTNSNMPDPPIQTTKDFITMANHMIGSKYDGDPLKLDSFLDSVELLTELCEANNTGILLKFVLTRLEGKAREIIPDDPTSVKTITDSLKEHIKHEPSKVIEGRILALRAERNNLSKFSEKAEELAEQFRRSLCTEGFTKQKAKEIAIEKTVEMCRKSAKSDTIKAILSASRFDEPKEVIAKMIIEISNSKQERIESQSQRNFPNNRGNRNGNNFGRGNGHRNDNNSQRGNRSNNGSYRNNNQHNSGNQNTNHNNNNRSNNYGNGYNNNSRGNQNNRQNRNGNQNNSNVHTIRIVSGNEQTSQAERQEMQL